MLFLFLLIGFVVCSTSYSSTQLCNDGVYFDCTNGVCSCVDCDDGCAVCYDNCHCEHCAYGWWLSGDSCVECTAGHERCRVCNRADQCTECFYGYGLWRPTGGCIPCSATEYCVDCYAISDVAVRCTQCMSGYTVYDPNLDGSTMCIPCTSTYSGFDVNAVQCTFDGAVIVVTECAAGFALYDGICYKCDETPGSNIYCDECEAIAPNSAVCTSCVTSYGLGEDGMCYSCIGGGSGTWPNAVSCTVSGTYHRTITACEVNYALYENNGDNACVDCRFTSDGASAGCFTCTALSTTAVECTECAVNAGLSEYLKLCPVCSTFTDVSLYKTCSARNQVYARVSECQPLISYMRGWIFDPDGDGTCNYCTDEGCLVCGPVGQCTKCRSYRNVEHCYDVYGVYNDVSRDVGILNSFVSTFVLGVIAFFIQ